MPMSVNCQTVRSFRLASVIAIFCLALTPALARGAEVVDRDGNVIVEIDAAGIWAPSLGVVPAPGSDLRILQVTIRNVGTQPWTVDPAHFSLSSDYGQTVSVAERPPDGISQTQVIVQTELPPQSQISGLIVFITPPPPADSSNSYRRVTYEPTDDQLIFIFEFCDGCTGGGGSSPGIILTDSRPDPQDGGSESNVDPLDGSDNSSPTGDFSSWLEDARTRGTAAITTELLDQIDEDVPEFTLNQLVDELLNAQSADEIAIACIWLAELLVLHDAGLATFFWDGALALGNDGHIMFNGATLLAGKTSQSLESSVPARYFIDFLNWRRTTDRGSESQLVLNAFDEVIQFAERDGIATAADFYRSERQIFELLVQVGHPTTLQGDWSPESSPYEPW
jgi:hypothetical protein